MMAPRPGRPAPSLALGIVVWLLALPPPARGLLVPSPRQRRAPQRGLCMDVKPPNAQPSQAKAPGLRKRWRRRKKDSVVDNKKEGAKEGTQTEPTTSQCPIFSAKFPRYRIDTSGASKGAEAERRRARRVQRGIITKLAKSSNGNDKSREESTPWGRAFQGVVSGASNVFPGAAGKNARRQTVESLFREEVRRGASFRWASSSSVDGAALPFLDGDFFSAAAFWRMASDVVAQPTTDEQHLYLALPETTPSVAQSLCDILNWHANLLSDGDGHHRETTEAIVRAEVDARADIPVVRFTSTSGEETMQHHRDGRGQLPSAEDTERRTKAWVKRLLVGLGICPFTKSEIKSGQGLGDLNVPVANIMYRHSSASSENAGGVYELMADTWEAMSDMVGAGPSGKTGVSSILLSAPGYDDAFELWAGPIFAMLEAGVGAIQAEEIVGVVCFHPSYKTPDGSSWPGFGHMHSVPRLKEWYRRHAAAAPAEPLSDDEIAAGGAWQRRTPHAVINVLRAEQLEAAEGRRKTGELYERNIRVLMGKEEGVGCAELTKALERERNL